MHDPAQKCSGRTTHVKAPHWPKQEQCSSREKLPQEMLVAHSWPTFVLRQGGPSAFNCQRRRNPALACSTLVSRLHGLRNNICPNSARQEVRELPMPFNSLVAYPSADT